MAINVTILAERPIYYNLPDYEELVTDWQVEEFEVLPTPEDVSFDIVRGDSDPIEVYSEWVLWSHDSSEGEIEWARNHVRNLREWVADKERNGYTVRYDLF
jgi:hypothetical protein